MSTILTPSVCNYGALRRATRGIGQIYDDAIASAGITAAQFNLLRTISRLGTPTQSELAGEMVMDISALGHTLKPLVREGWVETRKDHEDARRRLIALSRTGEVKLHASQALWDHAHSRFESLVGHTVSEELRKLLDELASPDFADRFAA